MTWKIVLSQQAAKDAQKIAVSGLKNNIQKLLDVLQKNSYEPLYEKLVGDMQRYYSRRINIQHRLVYQIFDQQKVIKILRMWSHYE